MKILVSLDSGYGLKGKNSEVKDGRRKRLGFKSRILTVEDTIDCRFFLKIELMTILSWYSRIFQLFEVRKIGKDKES